MGTGTGTRVASMEGHAASIEAGRDSIVHHMVGEQRLYAEVVRDADRAPITPTGCRITLTAYGSGTVIVTSTDVRTSAGLVEYLLESGYIAEPGEYVLMWEVDYSSAGSDASITILTNIVAVEVDPTYLMTLVPQLRLLVDDDPEDLTKRMKPDSVWKKYLVQAVRMFMADYSIVDDDGHDEVSPVPASESDDEKLIIYSTAKIIFTFAMEAIASERSRMFSISYDSAYAQLQDKQRFVEEAIASLDPDQAMVFDSETGIEFYGQVVERTSEAIQTWNA